MTVPEGLTLCPNCGEYRGEVRNGDLADPYGNRHLDPPDTVFAVRCICDGILCSRCKKNRIRRPISNRYDEETNTIAHMPYFGYMIPCAECKERERNETPEERQERVRRSRERFRAAEERARELGVDFRILGQDEP